MNNLELINVFSVFSGSYFQIPEKDLNLLQQGHLPLIKKPRSNCKKCFGRGYSGRNKKELSYFPCSCVLKTLNTDILKKLEDKYIKLFEELSGPQSSSTAG
jgi:hypothetical protein